MAVAGTPNVTSVQCGILGFSRLGGPRNEGVKSVVDRGHRLSDEGMMRRPCLPHRASPSQRPLLVISAISSIDEMHDGQLARPPIA